MEIEKQPLIINRLEELFRYEIISNRYMYVDIWSFTHIIVGYILSKFIKKPLWIFLLLITYEIFEAIALVNILSLYQPETVIDSIWDIIFGMIGFFIGWFV